MPRRSKSGASHGDSEGIRARAISGRGMRRAALGVAFAALCAMPSVGCCFCKRLFGFDKYIIRIHADADANRGNDTEVLIVWPSRDANSEFASLESFNEARAKAESDYSGGSQFAYFGSIAPGEQKEFLSDDDFSVRIHQPGELRSHCDAAKAYIFTTIGGRGEVVVDDPRRPYEGFIQIDLRSESVDVTHFSSRDEWDHYGRAGAERE